MIIKLHISCGNKWSAIARQLPGRTDNEIKNYWNTYLKKWLIKKRIETLTDKPSDSASGAKNCPGPSDQAPSPRPAPLTRDVVSQSLNAGALASESLGRNKNLESKKGFSRSSSTSRLLNKMATRVTSLKGLISASPQQIHDNSLIGIDNVISPSYDLDTYIGYSYEGVNSSDRTYSVPMETDVQDVLALDVLNAFDVQDALSTSIEEEDAFGIMDDWSEFVLEQLVEVVEEYYNNDQRSHI